MEATTKDGKAQLRAVLEWLGQDAAVGKAIAEGVALIVSRDDIKALKERPLPFRDTEAVSSPAGRGKRKATINGCEDAKSQKRARRPDKPQPLPICVNCSQEFDWHQNHKRACRSHDGTLEVDHEDGYWRDCEWDEEIDTPRNRREHPEGFVWSCCDNDGTALGCKRRAHQRFRTLPATDGPKQGDNHGGSSSPSVISVRDTDSEIGSETDDEDYEDFYDE
ncbi:hypothetical protein Micbo1qcDRAFT_205364 [Microdochium bolleyi]|uniref:C2H2-type domain-containing protein n=1 Tax=Microdochium bolleyi TaxID=196109 RepID=A0A136IZX8_9PEZI|nr:hypothetical protein Micbo1qcDRAFT_205364 [Microdochium bolleyi]